MSSAKVLNAAVSPTVDLAIVVGSRGFDTSMRRVRVR
jgi:hypothetical protein